MANRGRTEIENLIGLFINTLAVRVELSSSLTVRDLLMKVKEQVIAAQQHQDIPFEQVIELLQPEQSLAHSPLFQVMFEWQNAAQGLGAFGTRRTAPATGDVPSGQVRPDVVVAGIG